MGRIAESELTVIPFLSPRLSRGNCRYARHHRRRPFDRVGEISKHFDTEVRPRTGNL